LNFVAPSIVRVKRPKMTSKLTLCWCLDVFVFVSDADGGKATQER
jgi:hypothetical protein